MAVSFKSQAHVVWYRTSVIDWYGGEVPIAISSTAINDTIFAFAITPINFEHAAYKVASVFTVHKTTQGL